MRGAGGGLDIMASSEETEPWLLLDSMLELEVELERCGIMMVGELRLENILTATTSPSWLCSGFCFCQPWDISFLDIIFD